MIKALCLTLALLTNPGYIVQNTSGDTYMTHKIFGWVTKVSPGFVTIFDSTGWRFSTIKEVDDYFTKADTKDE